MYPGIQEQTPWPLISLHWLFGPQGLGWHGFCGGGATNNKIDGDIISGAKRFNNKNIYIAVADIARMHCQSFQPGSYTLGRD